MPRPAPPTPHRQISGTPSPQVQAWTAQAHGTEDHPLLTRYIAEHGRWPSFVGRWGNAKALEGNGWAAQLLLAVGGDLSQLRAVTITVQGDMGITLARLGPSSGYSLAMQLMAPGKVLAPHLGALRAEYAPGPGWHYEGLVSAADAVRLAGLAALDVQVRPLPDQGMFERQLKYMTKGFRRDAPSWRKADYAEHMLGLMAELGVKRLPDTLYTYGLPRGRMLGHSPNVTPPSVAPVPSNLARARHLAAKGHSRRSIATELGVALRTVQRWLNPPADADDPSPSQKPQAPALPRSPTPTGRSQPPEEAHHDQAPPHLQADHCRAGRYC